MPQTPPLSSAPVTPSANAPDDKSLRILLWLVAIGFFMQTLDATIVNTTLPAMARSFGESPLRMQSVVVAYSLTMAMLIPASGWVADRFGTRRVFVTAILLFVLGSVCCALSRNLTELVAARVLQGLGGALLLPVGRLAVLRAFPRERFLLVGHVGLVDHGRRGRRRRGCHGCRRSGRRSHRHHYGLGGSGDFLLAAGDQQHRGEDQGKAGIVVHGIL